MFPDAPLRTMGGYAQDSWTIARKLTLNMGARYNYDNGYVAAGCREAADPPGDVPNPAQCFDKVQFKVYKSFSPRLRAAYDVSGNGKTVIKGGWGRYHKLRYTDELQTANRNVITTTLYRWRDLNGNRNYDTGETNLALNGSDFLSQTLSGQTGALANGVANPNEQQPYTDEYSVQFERELVPNLAMRLTGAHSRALRQYRLANLRRPYESYSIPITNRDPGPDGAVNTADDPGTTITYYEYPAALSSSAFQKATIVNDDKANQKYSTIEVAMSQAAGRQVADDGVLQRDEAGCPAAQQRRRRHRLRRQHAGPQRRDLHGGQQLGVAGPGLGQLSVAVRAADVGEFRAPQRRAVGADGAVQGRRHDSLDYVERRADRLAASAQHQPAGLPSRKEVQPRAANSSSSCRRTSSTP